MRRQFFTSILPLIFWLAPWSSAMPDEGMGTPAAKAEFAQGEAARKSGDQKTAADHYRKAIELDPNFVEAHQNYVFLEPIGAVQEIMKQWDAVHPAPTVTDEAAKLKEERDAREADAYREVRGKLETQYQQWLKAHPDSAVYLWVLGFLNDYKDPHQAEKYYREALAIDPRFARAYNSLSLVDEVKGDENSSREDLRKAVEANPKDPGYLFYYAQKFRDIDRAEYVRLSMEVVRKFPDSERAPQSLYWLAHSAPTAEEKIRYLEMLKVKFPPDKFSWSSGGMSLLFSVYEGTAPAKALALAQEMIRADPKDHSWTQLTAYAQARDEADQLLAQGKAAEAIGVLDKVTLPRSWNRARFELLHAQAVAEAGDTSKAYSDLSKYCAATPSDDVESALTGYGKKLGKDAPEVKADIWALRKARAHPATPFSLIDYATKQPKSLADFRGHVFLLNFWYPQCGPCRGEFPYIQAVLDKYKDRGFEIAAVNLHPPEDDYVLPLLKGLRLGFIPLKSDDKWAAKAYKVRGAPTNFLIGSDGQVYFGPLAPVSTPEAQRTLELEVESLLDQAPPAPQADSIAQPDDPRTIAESLEEIRKFRDELGHENHDKMKSVADYYRAALEDAFKQP